MQSEHLFLDPQVVFNTDCCKAVVPVFFVLCMTFRLFTAVLSCLLCLLR